MSVRQVYNKHATWETHNEHVKHVKCFYKGTGAVAYEGECIPQTFTGELRPKPELAVMGESLTRQGLYNVFKVEILLGLTD